MDKTYSANVLKLVAEQAIVMALENADGSRAANIIAHFVKPAKELHQQVVNILVKDRKT